MDTGEIERFGAEPTQICRKCGQGYAATSENYYWRVSPSQTNPGKLEVRCKWCRLEAKRNSEKRLAKPPPLNNPALPEYLGDAYALTLPMDRRMDLQEVVSRETRVKHTPSGARHHAPR